MIVPTVLPLPASCAPPPYCSYCEIMLVAILVDDDVLRWTRDTFGGPPAGGDDDLQSLASFLCSSAGITTSQSLDEFLIHAEQQLHLDSASAPVNDAHKHDEDDADNDEADRRLHRFLQRSAAKKTTSTPLCR